MAGIKRVLRDTCDSAQEPRQRQVHAAQGCLATPLFYGTGCNELDLYISVSAVKNESEKFLAFLCILWLVALEQECTVIISLICCHVLLLLGLSMGFFTADY